MGWSSTKHLSTPSCVCCALTCCFSTSVICLFTELITFLADGRLWTIVDYFVFNTWLLRVYWYSLFDRQRIGRRADRASDRDRRRDEHELVDAVGGAILGEVFERENLAHGHAHDRDGDPVPRLVDAAFGVVRPHLAAPGVAGQRRELGLGDELQRLESKARRVAAGIAVPATGLETALHLPGAHDDVVAALACGVLLLRGDV